MKATSITLLVISSALVTAAKNASPPKLDSPDGWTLKSMTTAGVKTPALAGPGRSVMIFFKGGTISGQAGVNIYSGKAKLHDGVMKHWGVSMTEMASADADAMKQELAYIALLGKMNRYALDGKDLVLSDGTNNNQLRFGATVKPKAKPLLGTVWKLTGFEETDGTSVSHTPAIDGSAIDLSFAKGDKISGHSGVNVYEGNGIVIGTTRRLFISGITPTEVGATPELMAQESKFFKRLPKMADFDIVGSRLTLSDKRGNHRLLFEAK